MISQQILFLIHKKKEQGEKIMKRLEMKEFLPEAGAEIEDQKTGKVFKVTADIPTPIIRDFVALANADSEKPTVEDYDLSINIVKKILYILNEKKAVDDFVDRLNQKEFGYVMEFIGEYMKEAKETAKKKA